jgi:eukaryotic-like serine/threonine-protein kinase
VLLEWNEAGLSQTGGADDRLMRGSDSNPVGLTGERLGIYQVESLIGSGGMGEVYRARDTRLGRAVAIKVLPPALTSNADRIARFEREARLLASLNHPHIATVYGLEEFVPRGGTERVVGLVMELIDGLTLAEQIRQADASSRAGTRAGLPLDVVLHIADQIADALDAAHEQGIVHRDLKPANVSVTTGGSVKVLDFGIAKLEPNPDDRAPVAASTVTLHTREGEIVGTAAYMSPEQARGQVVTRRTDVWAFGCVLYEMLAGRPAFARATAAETLGAILHEQPDWGALPDSTPPAVLRILRRCLDKDLRRRARDIGDVRLDLEEAQSSFAQAEGPVIARRRGVPAWAVVLLALVAAGIGATTWMILFSPPAQAPAVTRTTLMLMPNQELDTGDAAGPLALSPDGRQVAYVAVVGGRAQLYHRRLDAFESRAIEGTEGAQYPFFSPDGEWVGFFANGKLQRVSMLGGAPLAVCDTPTIGRGATWADDGTIVFDPGAAGLMHVAAAGGVPKPITSSDNALDRQDLSWPQFLPGGRDLLVTVGRTGATDTRIGVLSLDTGGWRELGPGSQAQFLAPAHLVYHAIGTREGELHAAAFDIERRALNGTPVSVLENIFRAPDAGAAYFSVARNGTVVFARGGYERTLVRAERGGQRTPLLDERRGYRMPAVSPDGGSVAITIDPRPSQVWIYDISRKSGIPLAIDGHSLSPLWTPDGRRVAFTSNAPSDIYWRAADASAPAERLLQRDGSQFASSWSSDGGLLIFHEGVPNQYDIWSLPIGGTPRPLVVTPASELGGRLSPDDRWLAYESNESGRFEIYVRPFPNVTAGKWMISTAGGQRAVWGPDTKELFYHVGASMMRVAVDARGPSFTAGNPEKLFSGPFDMTYTGYALAKDGRFILVEIDPQARLTQLHAVLNWSEDITRALARR